MCVGEAEYMLFEHRKCGSRCIRVSWWKSNRIEYKRKYPVPSDTGQTNRQRGTRFYIGGSFIISLYKEKKQ